MNKQQINKILAQDLSKSKKIIALYDGGLEIKDVATTLGIKYNFAYNVISNYCRMNDVELRTNKNKGDSKKSQIIALLGQGKTKTEVATEMKCNYNYVFKIEKELKEAK